MKRHIPYFNFYPADFMNGVRGLSATEVGVYMMLLCRIYEESGPVEMHPLRLATYCGMRQATFQKTLDRLIALDKITDSDGMLFNDRAAIEISNRADKLKLNSKAGKTSAEKRQQKQQEASTDVQQTFNHTDTDTKERESNVSLSSASGKTPGKEQEVLALSKAFPIKRNDSHEGRASDYLEVCSLESEKAVAEACRRFKSGLVDKHNPKFAPTPAEFATVVRTVQTFEDLKARVGSTPVLTRSPFPKESYAQRVLRERSERQQSENQGGV